MTPQGRIALCACLLDEAEELAKGCAAEPNGHVAERHLMRVRSLYLDLCEAACEPVDLRLLGGETIEVALANLERELLRNALGPEVKRKER